MPQRRAGILPQQDQSGGAVGLGLHRRDRISENRELHGFLRLVTGCERRKAGQVAARGESHQTDAVRPTRAAAPDLGTEGMERYWVSGVERIAEDTRLHTEPAEPIDDRFRLVRRMLGVPTAREDDHVHSCHWRSLA